MSELNFSEELMAVKFKCIGKTSGKIYEISLKDISENLKVSVRDIEEEFLVYYKGEALSRKIFLAHLEEEHLTKEVHTSSVEKAIRSLEQLELGKTGAIPKIKSNQTHTNEQSGFLSIAENLNSETNSTHIQGHESQPSVSNTTVVSTECLASFSDLTKLVPYFNSDSQKAHNFIQNCDTAMQLASPQQKPLLLALIKSRISGNAEILLMNKNINTWLQLKHELNTVFKETYSSLQLHLEMTRLKQEFNETVIQFTQRCETLTRRRIQVLYTENPDDPTYYGQKIAVQRDMLNTFVSGLKKEIGTFVNTQRPKTLAEASQLAMEEEIRLGYHNLKTKNYNLGREYTGKNLININHIKDIKCYTCGLKGHISRNCFKNKSNVQNQINKFPNTSRYQKNWSTSNDSSHRHTQRNNSDGKYFTNKSENKSEPRNVSNFR